MSANIEMLREQILERNSKKAKKAARKRVSESDTFREAAIVSAYYLTPQSYGKLLEKWIKKDFALGDPLDSLSGDATSSTGAPIEIKATMEKGDGKVNFVQIRPHHNIEYYILTVYSFTQDRVHWLLVPSKDLYSFLPEFGGYAHGTVKKNGKITTTSIETNKDQECEYALRPSLFTNNEANPTKSYRLWLKLQKYEKSKEEILKCL